jgi:acyl carrier protein
MGTVTTEVVEKTLLEIVRDLIQDWGLCLDDDIKGHTKLVADLEFASVDIIQLCVAIEQHYGHKMGFQDLLMKDGSYVSDLSITQVADFLVDRLKGMDT